MDIDDKKIKILIWFDNGGVILHESLKLLKSIKGKIPIMNK
ncbi:MAG: hypothetical protein Ct9H90mP3_5280 [Flammeovirgaceae bacterium]|nr:MAG: hypothetical protein Ct9H90mP3_5280 [Flammeovirgaceae bacterium]